MKVIHALQEPITQAEFALLNDISEARVSQLVGEGAVPVGVSGLTMHHAYVGRLREQAAGRMGSEVGGLDLSQERAALAREMRHGHEIKNAVARGTYAPIELLAEVLAAASQAVVERFEQLPGLLKKACPDLTEAARDQVMATIANARNEWVRATEKLVAQKIVEPDDDQVDAVSELDS